MTYEEACKELDACCCDWRLKKATFDLEKLDHETISRKNLSELQEALDDIFVKITKGAIEVKAASSEKAACYLTVIVHVGSSNVTGTLFCPIKDSKVNITRKDFTYRLSGIIKSSLGALLASTTLTDAKELVRLANYVYLTEIDMLQSPVYDVLQRVSQAIAEERAELYQVTTEYESWTSEITKAMTCASDAWFKKVKLVPGMKIVLRDKITGIQAEKTIKTVWLKDSRSIFELTDGEQISLINSRFCPLATWVANTAEYQEIAHALKIQYAHKLQ